MPFFGRSTSPQLAGPNLAEGWATDVSWQEWEAPCSVIRGESRYTDALYRIVGGGPRPSGYLFPVAVTLRREPENPYDAHAIRAQIGGELVGYLAREIAEVVAPVMDLGGCTEMVVAGIVRGGSANAPNLGVHVWPHRRLGPGVEIELIDVARPRWPPGANEVDGGPEPTMDAFPPGQVIIDLLPERIAAGLTICFTGSSICRMAGQLLSRRDQEVLATSRRLTVADNLTREVDLLVVTDLRSASGKAKKAREYRTAVIEELIFWRALGVPIESA